MQGSSKQRLGGSPPLGSVAEEAGWSKVHLTAAANDEVHILAEGPFWDPVRERLLWVDIRRGRVFSGILSDAGTIEIVDWVEFEGTVGAVAPEKSGKWIVAGTDRLIVRGLEGETTALPPLIPPGSRRRLNDGKPDPAGRYLIGTLSLDGESEEEKLYSIDANGNVRVIDRDLRLSNGLTWSPDGATLYSVDTGRRVVYRRPYDPATGETGARNIHLAFSDGYPDGMTVDAEGYLWVAVWGIGEVHRFAPTGELNMVIAVPAPHTSSVAFAGPALDHLVITTATQDLRDDQLAQYPLSGRIFTTKPGVLGLHQPLWAGLALVHT